jgi:hypothetical protein
MIGSLSFLDPSSLSTKVQAAEPLSGWDPGTFLLAYSPTGLTIAILVFRAAWTVFVFVWCLWRGFFKSPPRPLPDSGVRIATQGRMDEGPGKFAPLTNPPWESEKTERGMLKHQTKHSVI